MICHITKPISQLSPPGSSKLAGRQAMPKPFCISNRYYLTWPFLNPAEPKTL